MKSRSQYLKTIRRFETYSLLSLLLGIIVVGFFNLGWIGIIALFIMYLLLNIYSYQIMKKCRCDQCGHVDIYEHNKMTVVSIKKNCPECHHRLDTTTPINKIIFKK